VGFGVGKKLDAKRGRDRTMVTTLDGSVGIVKPGSWWRKGRVTNWARDQTKVIRLLASVSTAQGGQKERWTVPPLAGADGACPSHLGDAIWVFQQYWKTKGEFHNIDGVVDPGGHTLRKLDQLDSGLPVPPTPPDPPPPPGPEKDFIIRDVRLEGWKPSGDVLEVNGGTPLGWIIDNISSRGKANGGNIVVKIMAHGLPGFVLCGKGAFIHPTLPAESWYRYHLKKDVYIGPGNGGLTVSDLRQLSSLAGLVKRVEFHSCLVARIGPCYEANGHASYDGNQLCFMLAQTLHAEVKASHHLQWYWPGDSTPGNGINFGHWNGIVTTWGPSGNIIERLQFPFEEKTGPPPPGTPV
jgi:hypothetical protein